MPATIDKPKATTKTRTTKVTPAKGANKKATGEVKTVKTPAVKFQIPPKPTTDPTSLVETDYQYTLANGNLRFWQGYDAKFKKNLMAASRELPQGKTQLAARAILIERGWSTAEKEDRFVAEAQAAADRKVKAVKAKTDKPVKPVVAKVEPEVEIEAVADETIPDIA